MEVTNTIDTGRWIQLDTGYIINIAFVRHIAPPASGATFFYIAYGISAGSGAVLKQMYTDNAQAFAAYCLIANAVKEFVTTKVMPILTTTPTIVSVDVDDWSNTGDVEVTGTDLAAPGTLLLVNGASVYEANTPDSTNDSSSGNTIFKSKVWRPTPPNGTYDVMYINKITGQFVSYSAGVTIP